MNESAAAVCNDAPLSQCVRNIRNQPVKRLYFLKHDTTAMEEHRGFALVLLPSRSADRDKLDPLSWISRRFFFFVVVEAQF